MLCWLMHLLFLLNIQDTEIKVNLKDNKGQSGGSGG